MPSVYEIITDRIIKLLEQGTVPWHKPWSGGGEPKNLASGKSYRGVNVLLLTSAGYESPWWLTYRQAKQLGGSVKKGERGSPVIYWNRVEKIIESTGDKIMTSVLRYFTLFNSSQCDGITVPTLEVSANRFSPIERCETIIKNYINPPEITHGGTRAYYRPPTDTIGMPRKERFDDGESYYNTLFHEVVHSSGHSKRLARKGVINRNFFGDSDYSLEELIAELGSCFLGNHAGIEAKQIDNSASYISSWLKSLNDDKRMIIFASGQSQKAVDYILKKTPEEKPEEPDESEIENSSD